MKSSLVLLLAIMFVACFAQPDQEFAQNSFNAQPNQERYFQDIMTNWLQYVSGTVQDWFKANERRNLTVDFWNSGLETVPSTKKEETVVLPKSTETKKENIQEKKERNWNPNINWDLYGYSVIDIARFIQTGVLSSTNGQKKDNQKKITKNLNNLANNPFNVHVAPQGLEVVILDSEGDLLYDTNNTIVAVENLNGSPEVIRALYTELFSFASRPYSNFVSHHLAKVFRSSSRPSFHITVRITLNQFISGLPYVFFEQFEGTVYWQNSEAISFEMGNLVVYDPPIARTGYRYFRFYSGFQNSLCRTVPVVNGQQYRLSFWINICDCDAADSFTVKINGVDQYPGSDLIASSTCVSNNCTGYKKISLVWTASSSSANICFVGAIPYGQVNLDDILFEQI